MAVQSCGSSYNTQHHGQICTNSGANSTLGIASAATLGSDIFSNGSLHTVTITYNPPAPSCAPSCNNLIITLDSDTNVLVVSVDLASLGLTSGNAYVGFTGGTGLFYEDQDIVSWSLTQGQPINPGSGLAQNFVGVPGELASGLDLTVAQNGGGLNIQPGTTPNAIFGGISQANWATITNGTAIPSSCLLSSTVTDGNGNPLCPFSTIECTTTANPVLAGANCPQSTIRNELFNQLSDVVQTQTIVGGTLNGGTLTINPGYGLGLAMAPDALTAGAQCSYPSNSPLVGQLCPQNIMTQWLDGSPKGGGTVPNPNSTFILVCCEPEWQTTPTIPLWSNTLSVPVSFSAAPPAPPLPPNFQAAQGSYVVFGAELPSLDPLDTTYPLPGEQSLFNTVPCQAPPTLWSAQNPQLFSVSGSITNYDNGTANPVPLTEGSYSAHYFSVDCDAFEELTYPVPLNVQPGPTGATNQATFKVVPFNIDLTAPTVTSITLNPSGGSYPVNSSVTATVVCTDPAGTISPVFSGIAQCGQQGSPQGFSGNQQTATTTPIQLNTSTVGPQSFTAVAVDAAGNSYTAPPVPYQVTKAAATVTLSNLTQTYTGNPLTPTATTNPAGLAIVWTGAPDTNVGNYPVTATVNDPNYQGNASGTFMITPAPATVTLSNLTQTYTGNPLTPTATTNPAGLGITWTGAPDTNAGNYPVTATVNNPNYQGNASGTFMINKASATVTLSNLTQAYTGNPLTPTATTNPAGLAIQWTGAPDTNVGTYPVTATVNNPNYQGSASGTFTITGVTISVNPTSLNFGTLYLGQPGFPQFVTVTNTGSKPITFTSIQISTPGNALSDYGDLDFCPPYFTKLPGSLPAGKSCAIGVGVIAITPGIFSPTPSTATLTITPSGGSAVQVPLTVLVINPRPNFNPSKLTFPTTTKGNSSQLSITVTNTGNTPLTIGTPTTGRGTPFAVVPGSTTCTGATIQPTGGGGMQSCVITVTFAPTSNGTFTGTLQVPDNAAISPQFISLWGTT